MGAPCLFMWQCSGFFSTTSVVGSFTSPCHSVPPVIPVASLAAFPSERHYSWDEEAPLGLPFCKVPLTCRQVNEVNPVVLLLCRKEGLWHPGPLLCYPSPSRRLSLNQPGLVSLTICWSDRAKGRTQPRSVVVLCLGKGQEKPELPSPVLAFSLSCVLPFPL